MPVKIELAIREGWKHDVAKSIGDIFEIRFINTETGKFMFRYAPKIEDKGMWEEIFALFTTYQSRLFALEEIISKVEKRSWQSNGDGEKGDEKQ